MPIPQTLVIGDTWGWTISISDYPAPTYTLKYAIRCLDLSVIDITATADGADHIIAVAAGTTAGYSAGDYTWTCYVEKGTGGSLERYTIDSGLVTLKPAMFATLSSTDVRPHAQKMLAAIEAVQYGRATHAELSLNINGKAIQYLKPDELIRWRSFFRDEVAREKRDEQIAQGTETGRRIVTRFGP